MQTLTLRIDNMHCGACVRRVMQIINAVPGNHAEEVKIGRARIVVSVSPDTMFDALAAAGYPAHTEQSPL